MNLEDVAGQLRHAINSKHDQILSDEKTTFGGKDAHEFKVAGAGMINRIVLAIENGKEYEWQFAVKTEEVKAFSPVFDEIKNSVTWKAPVRSVYESKDKSFSVDVPPKWKVAELFSKTDRIVLIGPADTRVHSVIRIEAKPLDRQSLDGFVSAYLKQAKRGTHVQVGAFDDSERYLPL